MTVGINRTGQKRARARAELFANVNLDMNVNARCARGGRGRLLVLVEQSRLCSDHRAISVVPPAPYGRSLARRHASAQEGNGRRRRTRMRTRERTQTRTWEGIDDGSWIGTATGI